MTGAIDVIDSGHKCALCDVSCLWPLYVTQDERANLENKPSMRLIQEPLLGRER